MKLNLVKDYQTGIYDYNDMLSTFVALAPVNRRLAATPTKISFSSQEWCGHVYSQLLFGEQKARLTQHSYFDGEADQQRDIDYPEDGFSEDALMLWARGLARPFVNPGGRHMAQVLTSLETARGKHIPLAVGLPDPIKGSEPTKPARTRRELRSRSVQRDSERRVVAYLLR